MEWLFLWLLFAVFSAVGASAKGRSGFGWFVLGLCFGPFGLLVFAMPRVGAEAPVSLSLDLVEDAPPAPTEVECPWCRELIKAGALKCKHCGSLLGEDAPARAAGAE